MRNPRLTVSKLSLDTCRLRVVQLRADSRAYEVLRAVDQGQLLRQGTSASGCQRKYVSFSEN